MPTVRFSRDDLDAFSRASFDRNPLHLDEGYARRTPFGDRVVFGVLQGLAALGGVAARPGRELAAVSFDFFGAASANVDYTLQVDELTLDRVTARIHDGRRPLLEAMFRFRAVSGNAITGEAPPPSTPPPRAEPDDLGAAEMVEGRVARGVYSPSWTEMRALLARFGAHQHFLDPTQIAVLLWSSYLVGMELPGKRALFSSLAVEFAPGAVKPAAFTYEARVASVNARGEHRIAASITTDGRRVADVTIADLVRDATPASSLGEMERHVGRGEGWKGRTALVTGASRGLGAALSQGLALHGATVIAVYWKSGDAAEGLRDSVGGAPGSVVLKQGDAGDPAWCAELARWIAAEHGKLDVLICNASPPIQPLWLETAAVPRITDFIAASVGLVSAPSAALLPLLTKTKGWNALISSIYVEELPANFPHYNAAKAAAEALLRTSIAEYRMVSGLIARPPKLFTDQTNTPLGRKGALSVATPAAAIVRRLMGPTCPGKVELLDRFATTDEQPA